MASTTCPGFERYKPSAAEIGLFFLCLPVISVVRGYVLAILWGWFAAGQFALPALSVPQAMGLSLILSLVTYQRTMSDPKRSPLGDVGSSLLLSGVALLSGWLTKLFL